MHWKMPVACLIPLLWSCHFVPETRTNHIVHAGEAALLVNHSAKTVAVAVAKSDVHVLARAVENGDGTTVRRLIDEGKALELPARTQVYVERESFNERQVKVTDGPQAGKVAWVPFAWLQSAGN